MGVELFGITFTSTNENGQGTFLGRTSGSWAKIMGFYVVYYTFLAGLIYFSVTSYADQLAKPGQGRRPTVVTRVDMPGASVEPFNSIGADIDGDGMIQLSFTDDNAKGNKAYLDAFDNFSKTIKTEGTVDCVGKNSKTPADGPCKVLNADYLNNQVIKNLPKSLKDGEPTVVVMLNKVIDWKPINNARREEVSSSRPFIADSVQIACSETKLTGEPVEKSNFNVELIGTEQALLSGYYPYKGNDKNAENKIAYNKPFVMAQIKLNSGVSKNDAWKLTNDAAFHYFRCQLFANNLEQPLVGKAFNNGSPNDKSYSTDLTALKIGYVEFGFNYGK